MPSIRLINRLYPRRSHGGFSSYSQPNVGGQRRNVLLSLLGLILLMTPLLHLGFSYYISAQIVGFLSLAALVMFSRFERRAVIFASICAFLFIVKLVAVLHTSVSRDLLVVLREMACFILLLLAVRPISALCRPERVSKLYVWFLWIASLLIMTQYFAIANGFFLSFPNEWFVMNRGTLEGVNLALYHESRLRPTGFYGEPSYMAFILISAFVVFLSYEARWKILLSVAALNALVLVFLGSLSGYLAFIIIAAVFGYLKLSAEGGRNKLNASLLLGVLAVFMLSVFVSQGEFIARLSSFSIDTEVDPSAYVRFVVPYLIFMQMIDDGAWFGYANSEMQNLVGGFDIGWIDNALFYLLLHYGIASTLLFIYFLAFYVRHPFLITYILIVLNFNGAYFSFDKTVVMALVLGFSIAMIRVGKSGKSN